MKLQYFESDGRRNGIENWNALFIFAKSSAKRNKTEQMAYENNM
jgi:hypothetical protein